jgi:hypothetical protein
MIQLVQQTEKQMAKRKTIFYVSLMKYRNALHYIIKNNEDDHEHWTLGADIKESDLDPFLQAKRKLLEFERLRMYTEQEFKRVLDGRKEYVVKYNSEFKHRTYDDYYPQVIYPIGIEDVEAFDKVFIYLYEENKYKN